MFFTFVAMFEHQLAPYNPHEQVGPPYEAPNSQHWLGTDDGGNDMLSLVIFGARVSLIVGFAGAAVAILIGGAVGILSGYFGGKTDIVLMRTTDYFLVIPDVPLMIVAAAVFGRNLANIVIIIGVIYWASTARLIRAQVITVRERIYVKRARALGVGQLADNQHPHTSAGDAADRRQHGADGRHRGVRRDLHLVPRAGRPVHDLVGQADPELARGRRGLPQRVVGDHPAGPVRHAS